MIITLLLASVFGGLLGAGIALYWGLGAMLIALGYVLGSFLGATIIIVLVISRFERQVAPTENQTPETAPQLSS